MPSSDKAIPEVLESLEAPPELLPYLDELLSDLPSLGTDPAEVIPVLRRHGVSAGARALDLGCGSGIVSVALARELGCEVEGIDGYPKFIERARQRAQSCGVSGRCRFRAGDLREFLSERGVDLVVFGSVGAILGSVEETVRQLRQVVRPGGLVLLDHAFSRSAAAAAPGYPPLDIAHRELLAAGDELLCEQIADPAQVQATNALNHRLLESRAAEIARRVPAMAKTLEAYLSRQHREEQHLEQALSPVLWLLRRRE